MVEALEHAEVVSVRVAVPLGILLRRLLLRYLAVGADDHVVVHVRDLAFRHALREVPEESVVARIRRHVRSDGGGASPEERELLVQQRRQLVLEAEHGRAQRVGVVFGAREHLAYRRVLRVRIRFVAEDAVELGYARRREQELLVHPRVRLRAERDGHPLGLVEDGPVQLEEPDVVQVVVVERYVSVVRRADLREHRVREVALVVGEVGAALRERRDGVEDALHPALREGRAAPSAPRVARHAARGRARGGAVAHDVVHVLEVLEVGPVRADEKRGDSVRRHAVHAPVGIVRRNMSVDGSLRPAPLELEVVRRRAERRRVRDGELLGELVQRIGHDGQSAGVKLGQHLHDVHRYRRALVDHPRVGAVVLDQRDVARALAGSDERIVVDGLVLRLHVVGSSRGCAGRKLNGGSACCVGQDLRDSERVDRGPPVLLRIVGALADIPYGRALGRLEDVELEVAPSGSLLDVLSYEA